MNPLINTRSALKLPLWSYGSIQIWSTQFAFDFIGQSIICQCVVATGVRRMTRGLAMATLLQSNQEPLVVKDEVGRHRWTWGEQVRGIWYFFPSVFRRCWLIDRKGIRPVKTVGLQVTIWLELLTSYSSIAPVVTTTSITVSSNKIRKWKHPGTGLASSSSKRVSCLVGHLSVE